MIRIDGSTGEGGGQMLRSALSLSLATGKAFRMENVRAKRQKPGLLRQHLTAVLAAGEIGSAEVEGATLGSKTLRFTPGRVRAGSYHFAGGTAGSGTRGAKNPGKLVRPVLFDVQRQRVRQVLLEDLERLLRRRGAIQAIAFHFAKKHFEALDPIQHEPAR